jgi:hypothetical protein
MEFETTTFDVASSFALVIKTRKPPQIERLQVVGSKV